ncbi:MAG: hypothetical protein A2V98_05185 [Planctomycetes bacterium RBG_16_64_12]|nr:MAG: hypothetical protein A2V98_05185 [Planctomycetes bacterium RBG_16_64_12]
MQKVLPPVLLVLVALVPAGADSPSRPMVELTLHGRKIEGAPLAWNTREVCLLGRDGRLWQFAPTEAEDFRKTSDRFQTYSTSELRAMLLREVGGDFEVTGTSHYLVAHPRGQRSQWAQRFEDLYRSFFHYFSVRGFALQEPPCPLMGIVCRNRQEFLEYSARRAVPAAPGVLGYYWLESNRIVLYDVSDPAADASDWQQNASTLIHEATHQTAFNTGIHSRFTAPPLWVAEGLATMFEAPGVYNSRAFPRQADRINQEQLRQFQELAVPGHGPERLAELIASDRPFRTRPSAAYATAWALTFYLVETQPGRYADYLALTAGRPPLETYTADERTADFAAVFGEDWQMLEARFLRFMEGVK